jgi:hypothetical protein
MACKIRPAAGHADAKAAPGEAADEIAPDKTGTADNRNKKISVGHGHVKTSKWGGLAASDVLAF